METYINFTVKHVFSIEKTNEPDTYWVLFNRLDEKVDTLMESITESLRRKRIAQNSAMAIRDQMLVSGATHWELETFDRFVRKYIVDKEEK